MSDPLGSTSAKNKKRSPLFPSTEKHGMQISQINQADFTNEVPSPLGKTSEDS
jgi:hypothetical protein